MNEQEPGSVGTQELIDGLKASGDQSKIHIAESLEELYLPDTFMCRSTSEESGIIQALRIIRKDNASNDLLSYTFYVNDTVGLKTQLIKTMRKKTREIPGNDRKVMTRDFESRVLKILAERQIKTVAGMMLLSGSMTRELIVQIIYPKVFMNVEPSIPPSQRDKSATAIASYFLKKGPIK